MNSIRIVIFLLLAGLSATSFAAAELEAEIQVNMCTAIQAGDIPAVQAVVNKLGGIDVPYDNLRGLTCLIRAADHGNQTVIDYCLANGADIENCDMHGRTPLMWSLRLGSNVHKQCIDDRSGPCVIRKLVIFYNLLSRGADYSAKNKDGNTILIYLSDFKITLDNKLLIKQVAEHLVAERIYRVCKVLNKSGGLLPEIITYCVLSYVYGDIEAHNKYPDDFLVVDHKKFFLQQQKDRELQDFLLEQQEESEQRCLLQKGVLCKKQGDIELLVVDGAKQVRVVEFIEEYGQSAHEVLILPRQSAEAEIVNTSLWSCFPLCSRIKKLVEYVRPV